MTELFVSEESEFLDNRFFKNLDTPKIKRQRKDERKMMSKSSLKESWCDYIDIR